MGGDPLQLGPVASQAQDYDHAVYMCRTFRDSFLSRYGVLVMLSGTHRQAGSSWFAGCLDRIRTGTFTDEDLMVLNSTSVGISDKQWQAHTQLRALKSQADEVNRRSMRALPGCETTYRCRDELNNVITHPARQAYARRKVRDLAPDSVTVKPGAIVLTTRAVAGVPTATQGVVRRCMPSHVECRFNGTTVDVGYIAFDFMDNRNERLASRTCIPLVLGWAMTIHRAQGCTLDSLAVDFSQLRWRENGLVYSALSRCRLLDGLLVRGLRREHVATCQDALSFYGAHTPA